MAKKKSSSVYIVALFLFLGGAGFLVYSGLSENSVYFLNVSEALAVDSSKLKAARLFGTVAEQDISKPDDGIGVSFRLVDAENSQKNLLVHYVGAVPDTFKAGAEVIIEGGLSSDGSFKAKTLMTKCPSKYEKENRKT